MKRSDKSIPEGKATITGNFFRMKKTTYNDFLAKVPVSKYSREEILEKLISQYIEKGDNIFNILDANPF